MSGPLPHLLWRLIICAIYSQVCSAAFTPVSSLEIRIASAYINMDNLIIRDGNQMIFNIFLKYLAVTIPLFSFFYNTELLDQSDSKLQYSF